MAEPLRIALDATSLYDVPTGVGRFTLEVLREAAGRPNLSVSAYAITLRGRRRLSELVPPGVAVVHGRTPLAARPLRALWRRGDHPRIDHWIGSTDVVHGTNFVVPPTSAAAVVTIHDLTYLRYPEMCTPDVLEYRQLVPRAISRGATVHTVSEFVRQEVIDEYRMPPERVVAVRNGVIAPPVVEAGTGRAAAGAERYIVSVGTVEPRKDLPGLVEAFDLVAEDDDDLRLVIAGVDGWGAGALDAAMERSPQRARIVRTGWVPEHVRVGLVAEALAVVVPSRYEGFGLPAAEAMAAGTPVVAASVGALPEVVGDAGLLVPGEDARALADAIARVTSDAELREDLRSRGRDRAAGFTWERTVDGLELLWSAAVMNR